MVLYKLQNHFDKILENLVLFFILLLNFIFVVEAFSLDFYFYDHENLVNGLCVLCTKDNFTLFKFFYIENSHLSMMSAAAILYSFIDFKKKNKFEKVNIVFFMLINFIYFLSLTLLFGIIFSSFFSKKSFSSIFFKELLTTNFKFLFIYFVFIYQRYLKSCKNEC